MGVNITFTEDGGSTSMKRWYIFEKLHGVISQNTVIVRPESFG
jgi:hypothetical protein